MNATAVKSETSLALRRTFKASRERLYQAWTQPEYLSRWFHPTSQHTTDVAELDLRVGGRYRFRMIAGDNVHTIQGVYQLVQPVEKLAFTWQWEGDESMPEMLVTVEFHTVDAQTTELVLLHERLASAEERDSHEWGWNGTFEQLENVL